MKVQFNEIQTLVGRIRTVNDCSRELWYKVRNNSSPHSEIQTLTELRVICPVARADLPRSFATVTKCGNDSFKLLNTESWDREGVVCCIQKRRESYCNNDEWFRRHRRKVDAETDRIEECLVCALGLCNCEHEFCSQPFGKARAPWSQLSGDITPVMFLPLCAM